MTPVIAAASIGDQEAVSLLLSRGADVNAKDSSGKTALAYTSMLDVVRRPQMIALLQKAGAK
jgi:ankyrin repeat protein